MLKNIGKWKVFALETGDFRLDGGAMMGSVPKVLWEKTNPSDSLNRIDLALRCLLLDDGENCILIETGMGSKISDDFKNMFAIKQKENPIQSALKRFNYKQEDISHVILTHLHFDHSGGILDINKEGELVPAFPNATYFISEANWTSGMNPSPRDSASYLDYNYSLLESLGNLKLVQDNSMILDGISTISVNGHTVGQQLVKVEDADDVLIFCSDLIPLKSHIRLPWIMGYDLNAALTLKEKTNFLNQAADEGWWLWFYHDPNTVALQIEKSAKYYDIVKEIRRSH
jgi:glyoxylase-like metal-dependent hydrolase (beta-lactamase superfamily II)|tara:strand:- start:395 stop:1252 length:858 start_codon:yes stop_codon:yes gene_type:complete